MLVEFYQSGGIAGMSVEMTIHSSGLIELRSRTGTHKRLTIAPEELATLAGLLASADFQGLEPEYETAGADLYMYEITATIAGQRYSVTTMDGAQHPLVLSQVLNELSRLKGLLR
jgi:hypothetical protein